MIRSLLLLGSAIIQYLKGSFMHIQTKYDSFFCYKSQGSGYTFSEMIEHSHYMGEIKARLKRRTVT